MSMMMSRLNWSSKDIRKKLKEKLLKKKGKKESQENVDKQMASERDMNYVTK